MLETCFSQSQESTVFNIYHHCDLFQIKFVNVSSFQFQQYHLCFKQYFQLCEVRRKPLS